MSEINLRLEALHHANANHHGGKPEEVVARAAAYYAFLLGGAADVSTASTKTTTTKDKSPDKPKEEAKAETVEQETANQTTETTHPEQPAVDYNDVKRCILGISSKISRDAATELLGKFGVTKGPDLKPADYAAFVAQAEPMLEGK